jgi:predicted nucleotidyltransferase
LGQSLVTGCLKTKSAVLLMGKHRSDFVALTAQSAHISREKTASSRAAEVLEALKERGVDAVVTGSLAAGRFGPASDVDFLVRSCPGHLKYKIESSVEDVMDDIQFDVVYRDELPPRILARMEEAVLTLADLMDRAHA